MSEASDSNRLRVLAVVPTPYVFGLQVVTLDFFSRLRRWADCHFLLTKWSDGEFGRRLDAMGVPHTSAWMGMFSRRLDPKNLRMTVEALARVPGLYAHLWRLARRFRPDLIYTANHHELILLGPLLRLLRIPVLCHMHDPPPNIPFQRASFRVWSQPVTQFVAISEDVQRRLGEFPVAPERVGMIHNGIDLAQFPRGHGRDDRFVRRFGWPEGAVVAGLTGQMHDRKGQMDLLEAAAALRDRVPALRVVIGGKETGEYPERLRRFAAEKGLGDRVGFSGWADHARDFYSGLDVFVLASRHEEGFGLVVAEAMACGVATIATRSGGAAEIFEDGRSGLLVDRSAPDQLADALLRLASDPELRVRFAEAGRCRVEREFDLDLQTEKLKAALFDVARGGTRRE